MSKSTRTRAAEVAAALAERLRDPGSVAATTEANRPSAYVDHWQPASLSRGYPGLALVFTELGYHDAQWRTAAHDYLRLAAEATRAEPVRGPFRGLGALATSARAASARGDYAGLLGKLDRHMTGYGNKLVSACRSARDAGRPVTPAAVDVINGLSGICRYLLLRQATIGTPEPGSAETGPSGDGLSRDELDVALRDGLRCLTSLTTPLRVNGTEVPGWWYGSAPDAADRSSAGAESDPGGYVDFGLAHGIPGPLTILCLAWLRGVRVPGQDEAIAEISEWLVRWQVRDRTGPYWPRQLALADYRDHNLYRAAEPARVSWCYGAPGTARALCLAGRALDQPQWNRVGTEAVLSALQRQRDEPSTVDFGLCHGWSGILHLLFTGCLEHPDERLERATDEIAAYLVDSFDPATPLGYRMFVRPDDRYVDLPGFLEGTAGVALALHAYAIGSRPRSEWDAALLIA